MTKPIKAKKNPRNLPANFDESLEATLPVTAAPVARPRISLRHIRLALGGVWVLAAIMAGVGVGLMLRDLSAPTVSMPPTPVASAQLRVTSAASLLAAGTIVVAEPAVTPNLSVKPATAVSQAQAGSVFKTTSLAAYQPAMGAGALQPGYIHFARTQGNGGTAPVR